MDDLWSVERFCRWKYGIPEGEPVTRGKRQFVARACKEGRLPAVRVLGEWRIDVGRILKGARHGG